VLVASNTLVSATRRWIRAEIRIPIYVLIIASLVTCTELIFKAWFPALDRSLGIFIPLIVTNCAIVARAEVFASRNPIGTSIVDGLVMGTGFALLLMAIGAFRELVSMAWLLAMLPPGAFFSLALAIAAKNALDLRRRDRHGDSLPRRSRLINR
jgi:electron transport complex protein RnfE